MNKFQIGIVQPYMDRPGLREKARAQVEEILAKFKHKQHVEWFEAELPSDDILDRKLAIAAKCMVTEILREGETAPYRLVEGITPPYLPTITE